MPRSAPPKSEPAGPVVAAAERKARVFISYSRKDSEFAETLTEALSARGFEAYLDKKDILPGEAWKDRLGALILTADAVVFVISPDSMASEICSWEVEEAERQRKKLLPVVHRAAPEEKVPPRLARLNYIFMRDGDDAAFGLETLAAAIDTDIDWIRQHTRMGELARRWETAGRPTAGGRLLRREELADAEQWLLTSPKAAPDPTEAQRAYVRASRAYETAELDAERAQIDRTRRFQRRSAWALSGVALLVLAMLATVMWQDYTTKLREQAVFTSAAAEAIKNEDFDYAMRLALLAYPPPGATWLTPSSTALEAKLAGAAQLSRSLKVLQGQEKKIHHAALSPDGIRLIVMPDNAKTAAVWDLGAGKQAAALQGHTGAIISAAFDPTGQRILSAAADGTVRIWNAATGKEAAQLKPAEAHVRATFSPDGKRILTSAASSQAHGAAMVRLWDAETNQQVAELSGREAVYSPDGTRILVTGGETPARIWDADLKTQLAEFSESNGSFSPLFSPDGKYAALSVNSVSTKVWHTASGTASATFKATGPGERAIGPRFSPDGKHLVHASTDGTLQIWDIAAGKEIAQLRGHTSAITAAAFSRDGSTLVSASADGTARLWATENWQQFAVLRGHTARLAAALISPDNSKIITVSADDTIRIWDAARRPNIRQSPEADATLRDVTFSPDSTRLVTIAEGKSAATILDAATLREVFRLDGQAELMSVAFDKAGGRIVTVSDDKVAALWQAKDGKKIADLAGHTGTVSVAQFSAGGTTVITGSGDATARVWSASSGEQLAALEGNAAGITSVALSPDGKRALTASEGHSAKLWDVPAKKELANFPATEKESPVTAFSPDGRKVIATSKAGVTLHDASNGAELPLPGGFPKQANGAAFSPDSERLAVASQDGPTTVWDLVQRKQIAEFAVMKEPPQSISFSRDGSRLLMANTAGAELWDLAEKYQLAALNLPGGFFLQLTRDASRIITGKHGDRLQIWDAATGTEVATIDMPVEALHGLTLSPDATRVASTGFRGITLFDLTWATKMRGASLRDRVCREKLAGIQDFTARELQDPVLSGIDKLDQIARNPCLRRGVLHWEFYAQRTNHVRQWAAAALHRLAQAVASLHVARGRAP